MRTQAAVCPGSTVQHRSLSSHSAETTGARHGLGPRGRLGRTFYRCFHATASCTFAAAAESAGGPDLRHGYAELTVSLQSRSMLSMNAALVIHN